MRRGLVCWGGFTKFPPCEPVARICFHGTVELILSSFCHLPPGTCMPGRVGPCHQAPGISATVVAGQLGGKGRVVQIGVTPPLSCVTLGKCLSLSGPSV